VFSNKQLKKEGSDISCTEITGLITSKLSLENLFK